MDRTALLRLARVLALVPGLPAQFRPRAVEHSYAPRSVLTHVVDVRQALPAKRAAMQAHVSQTGGGEGPRALALYLRLPAPAYRVLFGREWYVLHGAEPGRRPDLVGDLAASAADRSEVPVPQP